MNILQITSSVRGKDSESTRVTNLIVNKLVSSNPDAKVVHRDFGVQPHPVLDGAAVGALFTPADQRSAEQAARVALDDALIAEAQAADVIVIGAPMYNFGMPVQLKNWFDAIARSGVTFRYTETGPEGLLKNKKVYVATARGGVYPVEADPQVPHIRMLLNFLGLTDHTFIYSSGLNMGPEAAAKGQQAANEAVEAALA
ncbi:FMN-dependent NADH-azoreductase [Massilia varians]|uniref:FMN-dependent NADH-azoreductase n=1 Tax=Massilia varians TaxID=457921 RepID=UPI00255618A3|nr:NAD(P)H-dependent oxidoreductase [Massilia varians]MDK6078113.1 NAD(P)H-dependent oxidoreductase [Massilia varians]